VIDAIEQAAEHLKVVGAERVEHVALDGFEPREQPVERRLALGGDVERVAPAVGGQPAALGEVEAFEIACPATGRDWRRSPPAPRIRRAAIRARRSPP
jgi:hypothetical protein